MSYRITCSSAPIRRDTFINGNYKLRIKDILSVAPHINENLLAEWEGFIKEGQEFSCRENDKKTK